jgi:xanthine dehydrogenase molybdopterin-binding subunit B
VLKSEFEVHASGMGQHRVTVQVKRIGGGFGGKETAAALIALPTAAIAKWFETHASIFSQNGCFVPFSMNRSIKCTLERYDDMALTGTRHPMLAEYRVAVDAATLRLRKLELDMYSNCGHSPDLSIAVMCWSFHTFEKCVKPSNRSGTRVNRQRVQYFRAAGARLHVSNTHSIVYGVSGIRSTAGGGR